MVNNRDEWAEEITMATSTINNLSTSSYGTSNWSWSDFDKLLSEWRERYYASGSSSSSWTSSYGTIDFDSANTDDSNNTISKSEFLALAKKMGIPEADAKKFFEAAAATRKGSKNVMSLGEWRDAFGGEEISRTSFKSTVANYMDGVAFSKYASTAGGGEGRSYMSRSEFSAAVKDAYGDDAPSDEEINAAFDAIAEEDEFKNSISADDWKDAFGSANLSSSDFKKRFDAINAYMGRQSYTFDGVDTSNNNAVSYDEFAEAAKKAGITDETAIKSAFNSIARGDNSISKTDFDRAFGSYPAGTKEAFSNIVNNAAGDKATQTFRSLASNGFTDASGNDVLTTAELRKGLESFGTNSKLDETQFVALGAALGLGEEDAKKVFAALAEDGEGCTHGKCVKVDDIIALAEERGTENYSGQTTWNLAQFKNVVSDIAKAADPDSEEDYSYNPVPRNDMAWLWGPRSTNTTMGNSVNIYNFNNMMNWG
jgi:Ca2+-binding EF-hand superfamily protein